MTATRAGSGPEPSLSFDRLTWVQLGEYLARDDRVIVPLGSCEEHGRHLTFVPDSLMADDLGRAVSAQTGVAVIPTLPFGVTTPLMGFPGTIDIRATTYMELIADILGSLHRHGFRRIILVNGHAGNFGAVTSAAMRAVDVLAGLRVKLFNWYLEPEIGTMLRDAFGAPDAHAAAGETSIMMALHPELVSMEGARAAPLRTVLALMSPKQFKEAYPDGAAGADPTRATAELGRKLFEKSVSLCTAYVEQWEGTGG